MFRKKYQTGGIDERQYFADYLKEAEGTDAVMTAIKNEYESNNS